MSKKRLLTVSIIGVAIILLLSKPSRITYVFSKSNVTNIDGYFAHDGLLILPYSSSTSNWQSYDGKDYEYKFPPNWKINDNPDHTWGSNTVNLSATNEVVPTEALNTHLGIQSRDLVDPNFYDQNNHRMTIDEVWNDAYTRYNEGKIIEKRQTVLGGVAATFERIDYHQTNVDNFTGHQNGFNGDLDVMQIYTNQLSNFRTYMILIVSEADKKLQPWQIDDFLKMAGTFKIK